MQYLSLCSNPLSQPSEQWLHRVKLVQDPWTGQGSVLQNSVSSLTPSQFFPPDSAAGSLQVLSRCFSPTPQSEEQELHSSQPAQLPCTGHGKVLQAAISPAAPEHGAPPNLGGMHCRPRSLTPPPQFSVQSDQPDHGLHTPSIGTYRILYTELV